MAQISADKNLKIGMAGNATQEKRTAQELNGLNRFV